MKDLPNPFWAFLFMVLGCILLLAVLLKINGSTTTVMLGVLMAITTAGTSLISGAYGYINGHKDGALSVSVPSQPSPGASTVATVGPPGPAPVAAQPPISQGGTP
jgi:hypothetical protein